MLTGLASDGSGIGIPVAVDPATGRLLTNATGASGGTSSTFGATFPTTGTAVGASDGTNMQPLQVDGSGNLKVNVEATSAASTSANLYTGHITVGTSAVQLNASSYALINGLIIKAPLANSATIYVGLTGVTTSTGDILEPGESRGYAISNTNLLYIISVASTSDIVSYSGN